MLGSALIVTAIIIPLFIFGIVAFILSSYKKVPQGQAIIKSGLGGTAVSFSGMTIVPVIHQMELVDLTIKKITIDRRGKAAVIDKNQEPVEFIADFMIKVNATARDVQDVVMSFGAANTFNTKAVEKLFKSKFEEAIESVLSQHSFEELFKNREEIKFPIIVNIGRDLNGFMLDDLAITHFKKG